MTNLHIRQFPNLDSFIRIYFGQDFDLIADTFDGLLEDFLENSGYEERYALQEEIRQFLQQKELDQLFRQLYENDVDPLAWGHTTKSFLEKILQLLKE